MLDITNLHCEYAANPVGIDVRQPRLGWTLHSSKRGARQTAWQIAVAASADDLSQRRYLWDTGKTAGSENAHHPYAGPALRSRQRCWWQVRVWDEDDQPSAWSAPAFWEMGLLDASDWRATWITPDWDEDVTISQPAPMLRRKFTLKETPVTARLYVTSLGVYEARLNGQRVSDWRFTPGWTSYEHRIQYQTYDVTKMLTTGDNAVGVLLGDGWYRGFLGFQGQRNTYGDRLALLLQLHVTFADGAEEIITSDEAWRAALGPIRASDLYNGEVYDARRERPGWDRAGYPDRDWAGVRTLPAPTAALVAQNGPPVRPIEELSARAITVSPEGETIVDFGQNLVGGVRIRMRGEAGQTVRLRHAEVLQPDGNLYTENLRSAQQTDEYILKGEGEEIYEPTFTFHGFRYLGVTGYPGELTPEDVTAVVLHSDMAPTGEFACSHPLLNQLQHNIVWGQKGNFLDVPTDCPQRDERLGWTGDAQVFASTAAFNYQIAPFMTKWLRDLALDQHADGAVPHVVPDVLQKLPWSAAGATGWGDAAIIVPWTLYQRYGDTRILAEQYASMKAWVEYMRANGDNELFFGYGFHFGDWLALDTGIDGLVFGLTDVMLIGTAFYAYSTELLAKIAAVLGKTDDAAHYRDLHGRIVAAFQQEFLTPAGRLASNTQTAYVLALMFDLLPEAMRGEAVRRLVADIRRREMHLSTGFLGTPYLCHVLERFGQLDVAYALLLQESYPSWLFPVTQGATTIWERWDGQKPDGSFQTPSMNSFNHYAYGAVGSWMYRTLGGLEVDPAHPGFTRAIVAPQPGDGITWAKTSLQSMVGRYAVDWSREGDSMTLKVAVPANGAALVKLPDARIEAVTESGVALADAPGCANPRQEAGCVVIEVGAGEYTFQW
jgi:alpha-L-rhamnosidase